MNVTWRTSLRHASTNYLAKQLNLPGHSILSLVDQNYTVAVFEKLSTSKKKKSLSTEQFLLLKMDLFKDYTHPKPFPTDMFLRLPNGSPDQAYVFLAQKGTGKVAQCTIKTSLC